MVEILVVLSIIAVMAIPFTNIFIFGVKGSHDNSEYVLAYNLAREKLEEIKSLPFDLVKSDYTNFRDVYQDRYKFDEAYYNEDVFVLNFSDIFTNMSLKGDEYKMSYNRLKLMYPKTYLRKLITYPDDYTNYRRVVMVDSISESAMPPKMKKISVLIFEKSGKKIANIVTIVGDHK